MAEDKMQKQRFELKYLIDEVTAAEVRSFASAHLDADENGADKPDYAYPVRSLLS